MRYIAYITDERFTRGAHHHISIWDTDVEAWQAIFAYQQDEEIDDEIKYYETRGMKIKPKWKTKPSVEALAVAHAMCYPAMKALGELDDDGDIDAITEPVVKAYKKLGLHIDVCPLPEDQWGMIDVEGGVLDMMPNALIELMLDQSRAH